MENNNNGCAAAVFFAVAAFVMALIYMYSHSAFSDLLFCGGLAAAGIVAYFIRKS